MPLTYNAIGATIGIGIHCDDRVMFNNEEINEMIKTIHLVICPRFDKNFKILLNYYRNNVYHKEIPIGDFYNDFKKNNEQEFLDFEKILKNSNNRLKFSEMKKVKIICTIGPSSLEETIIKKMDDSGVDLFRINLSHTRIDDLIPIAKI